MLEFKKAASAEPPGIVADRRLWLTQKDPSSPADGTPGDTVVEDGDLRAAFLLAAGPGDVIPAEKAASLHLVLVDGKVVQGGGESVKESEPDPASKKGAKK